MMKYVFIVLVSFIAGFLFNTVATPIANVDRCADFTRYGVKWVGYIGLSYDGDVRCFWLEQQFPKRVIQGVETKW
jgi:hypothetical protein